MRAHVVDHNTLNVQARYEDGTLSPAREWHLYAGSAPEVAIGECTAGSPVTFTPPAGPITVYVYDHAEPGDSGGSVGYGYADCAG